MDRSLIVALDRRARRRYGLVTSTEATAILGRCRLSRWVSEGRLERVQPRLYRTAGAPVTWHQQLAAAQGSSGGIVSHESAAELWGLIEPVGAVEVSVVPPRSPTLWRPARAHRIRDLRPEMAVLRKGVLVTDPIRTLVDLGLSQPGDRVADALAVALSSKLLSVRAVERLRADLSRRGRNGVGVIGRVLDDRALRDSPEESLLEARFSALARRYDLPTPHYQHEVWHDGRHVARLDAAYPGRHVAIEVDGYRDHSSPAAFQVDRTRQNRLVALGWTVLRFTWMDVVKRPGDVARTILSVLSEETAV